MVGPGIAGLSLPAMSIGGLISALIVALLAGIVSRTTILREDACLVGFYLISLALGSLIVSIKGSNVDLIHIMLGDILAVDNDSMIFIASVATLNLVLGALIYRPMIIECFDHGFMRSIGAWGGFYHGLFIVMIVLCMVAAFQALGTLMALGMMMLPAISARFWAKDIWAMFLVAVGIALVSGYLGLLFSYHFVWPSGPSIVLVAGVIYLFSLIVGQQGSLRQRIA